MQRVERLEEAPRPPVEHVVVRERAAVDPRGRQAPDVRRVHPVEDGLRERGVVARRHGGLEVDDARVRPAGLELGERVAPDVVESRRTRDRPARGLGEFDVAARGDRVFLEEPRVARVRQDLVDAAAGHRVAGQEERRFRRGRRVSHVRGRVRRGLAAGGRRRRGERRSEPGADRAREETSSLHRRGRASAGVSGAFRRLAQETRPSAPARSARAGGAASPARASRGRRARARRRRDRPARSRDRRSAR